ncbi:MAG: type II toxin-antitoxin system HicB family antitoxin [Lachnospiraceae bacterium]|nr:type II toxin-antitoxin system HicB family antitoxin [Lachnospiraceae bacterium]
MTCQVLVTQEEKWYVATDIASNVASQGKTMDEALSNLKEALELYYEDNETVPESPAAFLTTIEVSS